MIKKLIILALLISLGAAVYFSGFFQILLDRQRLNELLESFGLLAPLVYIASYAIAVLFFAPGLPLTILGGLLFGPVFGTIYVIIGASLGMSLAFLSARYLLRDSLLKKFGRSELFQKMERGIAEEGPYLVITTRLIPIFPFNLQNYLYGLTSIKFLPYCVLSSIFIIPGTLVYVLSASSISAGNLQLALQRLLIASVIFVILALLPRYIKKWKRSKNEI